MKRTFFIYKLTAPNGKVYIGQTYNINRRFACYRNLSIKGQPKIYNSIKKYGWENFKKEILFDGVVDQSEIDKIETEYIEQFRSIGLNISLIGQGGNGLQGKDHPMSKRVLQISLDFDIVNEYESISDAAKSTNTNMSCIGLSCRTGNPKSNGFYWRFKNDYNKQDLINLLNKPPVGSIPIYQMDKYRNIIKKWDSQSDASKSLQINQANIWRVLVGEGYLAGGFCWCYVSDYENGSLPQFKYKKRGRPITVKNLSGQILYYFESINQTCEELKVDKSSVIRQLKRKVLNPKKYLYEYTI